MKDNKTHCRTFTSVWCLLNTTSLSSNDLVVSEGHGAANTLLHADVAKVTAPPATGLRDHLTGAEEPEEALLEVLGATHAAAVELYGETQRGLIKGPVFTPG